MGDHYRRAGDKAFQIRMFERLHQAQMTRWQRQLRAPRHTAEHRNFGQRPRMRLAQDIRVTRAADPVVDHAGDVDARLMRGKSPHHGGGGGSLGASIDD